MSAGYLGSVPVSSSYLVGSAPVSSSYPGGPTYPGTVSSSYLPPPPPAPYHPPLYAPYSATPYLPHPTSANMVRMPSAVSRTGAAVTKPVTTLSSPVTSASSGSHSQQSSHRPGSHPSSHQPLAAHHATVVGHQTLGHPSPVVHRSPHPSPVVHQPPHQLPSHQPSLSRSVTPATSTTTGHRDTVTAPNVARSHSPRGHSPTRERESYSSNVSSLSRGSVSTPVSLPPYSAPSTHHHSSLPYSSKQTVWASSGAASSGGVVEIPGGGGRSVQHGGGSQTAVVSHSSSHSSTSHGPSSHPYPSPHISSFPPAPSQPPAPAPPVVSSASTQPPQPSQQPVNPIPFSAESLFQSNQRDSDVLRRELDTRFLVSNQDRGPYLRTEMHHHQHQHTHVHQHTTPIIPPPPPLYASPLFKDMPKLGVDSPFYRQSLGLAGYPGYSAGLLHPTLGPSTPFVPPTHIPTFTPKQLTPEPSKPKPVKTGKWNAMHVRIAWEIYHHQQKGSGGESKVGSLSSGLGLGPGGLLPKGEVLRPPSHMFGPPHPFVPPHRPPGHFEHTPPSPFPPVGGSMFARYPSTPAFPSLAGYPTHAPVHDPWSRLQPRGLVPPTFGSGSPWSSLKTEEERDRERNRERARREEKQRRAALNQQSKSGRERSPVRELAVPKDEDHLTRGPTDILGRPSVDLLRGPPGSDLLSRTAPADILGRPPAADLLVRAPPTDILGRSSAADILTRSGPTDILGRPAPPPDLLGRSAPTAAAAAAAAAYLQQRHHPRHPSLPSHYPATPHWDHPYRYDPLRFNPLMSAAALREEEEHRAKLYAAYPGSTATLRAKAPSPHRGGVTAHSYPPTKEEPSQSR